MYTINEIAQAIDAEIVHGNEIQRDFKLLTDSRTLNDPENSIFFALKSTYNDGHKYVSELLEKGVNTFIISDKNIKLLSDSATFLLVNDTLEALQKLAKFHRNKFNIPVIGITGSNGKTIVKEWISHLLGNSYKICANPKSYNSQIGVPLSVWQLNQSHQLGIFEAGISTSNEMFKLEEIIQPEIGILTHLGSAHNEGFDSPDEKLNEKLLLFKNCKTVLCAYNPKVIDKLNCTVISFGFNESSASLNITEIQKGKKSTFIKGEYQSVTIAFSIPFTDDASIENACLCCLTTLYFDNFNAEAFYTLSGVSMRLELKKGIHGCILVNDSYSNDLNALSTALSFLQQQSIHSKTTVILSDIVESGLPEEILYQQIRNLLLEKKIKRLIGIGKNYMLKQNLFEEKFETNFYPNTEAFLNDFYTLKFQEESILIKGARNFEFEKIVKKLEQESHGSVLEINLSAALKNLNTIKNKLPENMKIMAMVKAFAYGSGTYEVAKLLQNKVDYLAVAYADEGVALRKSGIATPIMVLNTNEEAFEQLIEYSLEPVIFSLQQLKSLLNSHQGKVFPLHIELDTGMHRLGFVEEEIEELCAFLEQNKNHEVVSVFSHFSASDEAQYDAYSTQQVVAFKKLADKIEKTVQKKVIKHISNTAAALRFKHEGFDMVRLGIGLYGIDPSSQNAEGLEPVFTLKTHISQIKTIEANESIGYSRKSISDKKRKIAVLALGYADGLNRALSNGVGGFYIHNTFAPITGNVCMDMCMVDVSEINCEEGDEAILFGKEHPIEVVSKMLNTIPYEILTSISQRVKRVYVSE